MAEISNLRKNRDQFFSLLMHQRLSDSLSQCSHLLICMCNRKIQADLVLFLYFCFQYDFNFPAGLREKNALFLGGMFEELPTPWILYLVNPISLLPCIRMKGRDKPLIWNLFFISYFVITSGLRYFLWWGLRKGNSLRLNQDNGARLARCQRDN